MSAPRPLLLPRQYEWWGLLPTVAGLFALSAIDGVFSALLAGPPGLLWLVTGLSLLLLPGDPRVTAYLALASLVAVLVSLPLVFAAGLWDGLLIGLFGVGCFIVCGRLSLTTALTPDAVPEPDSDLHMQSKVGFDEAIMGYFLIAGRLPGGKRAERMCDEAMELGHALDTRGWIDYPDRLHQAPDPPDQVNAQSAKRYGFDYERISFDSGFKPDPALPGAERWAQHHGNNRAVAWMLRHPGPTRPWLVCIHGYRMGESWIDFGLFKPGLLHKKLGLNILMPILPLHGPRRIGRKSGDQYLDGDLLDLLFAQSQALWDLRRWIAWLRSNEDRPQIGVYGVSLGGYNTGLLTGYEAGLDFCVAGIPVVDFAEALWRVIPPPHRAYFEARGLKESRYRELLRPVSPLVMPCRVPRERRFVFAATADRVVPVAQPAALAQHWDVETRWYQGSHMSIGNEVEPRATLDEAMRVAGWTSTASATAPYV
jgi:hypothetical protein